MPKMKRRIAPRNSGVPVYHPQRSRPRPTTSAERLACQYTLVQLDMSFGFEHLTYTQYLLAAILTLLSVAIMGLFGKSSFQPQGKVGQSLRGGRGPSSAGKLQQAAGDCSSKRDRGGS